MVKGVAYSEIMSSQSGVTASISQKRCPLCKFEGRTVQIVLSHIRLVHSNDPNFVVPCGLNGCATTSKSFGSLYSHIYRHHNDFIRKRKEQNRECVQEQSEESLTCEPTALESGLFYLQFPCYIHWI